jgi:hypothetical protein
MRKRQMARAIIMATKIQSVGRGHIGRTYVRKNYKRLVKERRLRVLRIRDKAARTIQGLHHIMLAKNIANLKRKEKLIREEQQRRLDELENQIDSLHSDHILGLNSTKIQAGARQKLARK